MRPEANFLEQAMMVLMERVGWDSLCFRDAELSTLPSGFALEASYDTRLSATSLKLKRTVPILLSSETEPRRKAQPQPGFTGDFCDHCGLPAMIRTGTCLTCQNCGATSGCG